LHTINAGIASVSLVKGFGMVTPKTATYWRDRPELRRQDPGPEQRGNGIGHQPRQDQHRAQQPSRAQRQVQQQRKPEPQRHGHH
jgi:hypothetical protein